MHANLAAHAQDQLPGDRQAQPGAAVAPRGGAVGLGEFLEEFGEGFGTHPDARVPHGKAQGRLGRAARDAFEADVDGAGIGELQGVADQIDEDLLEPTGIAGDQIGNVRRDREEQFESFLLGAAVHEADGLLEDFPRRKGNRLELEAAALDARQIQDIVDQAQKGVGRA